MANIYFLQAQDGDIRNLKRVEQEAYWESAKQISKPASESQVEMFLKQSQNRKPVWLKYSVIALGILMALLMIIL